MVDDAPLKKYARLADSASRGEKLFALWAQADSDLRPLVAARGEHARLR